MGLRRVGGKQVAVKYYLVVFAFIVLGISARIAAGEETRYLLAHQESDSRFLTSIERIGPCKVSTPPVSGIRVPWQIYPKVSIANHEEGSVIMELTLDADWCVRKATIVQSTKFWRLDKVSLEYAMSLRYQPDPKIINIKDGNPTVVVKWGWGASQGKR